MVVQATLLFRVETWVMSPRIGNTLGRLHHRVVHRLYKMQPRRDMAGRWVYPPLYKAMGAVGVDEAGIYVLCFHNNVSQYIATHLILDIFLAADQQS